MPYPENFDPDFDDDESPVEGSYRVTAAELRQFIERIERLDQEIADIRESRKEVLSEAKSRGYDTKILQQVIRERKKASDAREEEKSLFDLYWEALL